MRGAGVDVPAPQDGPRGEPVVRRALSLLDQFSDERRVLGLSDLARLAGMPPATALRFVRHLTAWGALERLEDGRYVVGVRLWEVASLAPRGHGVRQLALPYLEDLYEVTHHHVLLAVLEGSAAVLIDRLSSRNATEVAYRVGGRLPLRTTAVGQVLLAHSEPGLQRELIAQPGDREPGTAEMSERELRAVLASVKAGGVAVVRRVQPSRTVSVAAPVHDATGLVAAAISIVVPEGAKPAHELIPLVRAAGRAVSRSLGHRQPTSAVRSAGAEPAGAKPPEDAPGGRWS